MRRKDVPADAMRVIQVCASFDVVAKPVSHLLHRMIAQHRLLAETGLTGADVGLRHEVRETTGTSKTWRLVSSSIGHAAAPIARGVHHEGEQAWDRDPVLRRQIARHAQVERLLRAGRDPLRPGAEHVLADPVVAALVRHLGDPDDILASMPVDLPFVTRRNFFQMRLAPACHEDVAPVIHGELEPGRLRANRVGLSDRAHYATPEPDASRLVGILTIRRETWPMDMRLGIVGRRMSEIVDLPGIPDTHVVRTCSASSGSMVMRIEGDHGEVPIR